MLSIRSVFCFLLLTVAATGCGAPSPKPEPPKPPEIVINPQANQVYQFQYDNGSPLDMSEFLVFLDKWLKKNPELSVKSVVPQVVVITDDKKQVKCVGGVLVFMQGTPAPKTDEKKVEEKK